MKKYLAFILFFFYSALSFAAPQADPQIEKLGQQWATALSSGNPQKIAALYDKNAFLYATFNNKLSTTDSLLNYFKKLMQHKNLAVQFNKQNIRRYNETAINSGLYTFSYTDGNKTVKIPARYTFVYTLEPQGWLIVDHHSSQLPEE